MSKGKHSNGNKKVNILLIIRILSIIVAIICIINIVKWYTENKKNGNLLNEINTYVEVTNTITIEDTQVEEYKIDFKKLKEKNEDIVAWLKVNGTLIEYPVVQSKDNYYYLTRSIDKTYNSAGWIFADYNNKLDSNDKNLVIYGHNRRDGTMFGTLKDVLQPEWYETKENQFITLEKETGTEIYQVFSVYQIEVEDYYIKTNFNDSNEFEVFINTIKSRSVKNFNHEVTKDDNILTLSTCANNNKYRVVVHAKRVEKM